MLDFGGGWYARRVDIVDAGSDLIGISDAVKGIEQLHARTGALDRDNVRVHPHDGVDNVVELRVAHVSVNLGLISNTRRRKAEGVDAPPQILGPVGAAQGQTF